MPRLLDLFCGAGGCARGYQTAGFEVVGIDIMAQPRYIGDCFVQNDALSVLSLLLDGGGLIVDMDPPIMYQLEDFDAIHASPPCQGYSIMMNLPWLKGKDYPLLIQPTMELLEATGKPYVVENVMGARHGARGLTRRGLEVHGLKAGWLCGAMFGLPFYRHRLFATNWFWLAPGHPKHRFRTFTLHDGGPIDHGRPWENHDGSLASGQGNGAQGEGVAVGHAKGWRLAKEAMGIDWDVKRCELTQMIPPAYTEYIGTELLKQVTGALERGA